jgi:hypothetical protein
MHEILPKTVVLLSSPAAAGELSRRSRSELAVQNTVPFKTGLVGNSRMWLLPTDESAEFRRPAALTGLRKTSNTSPACRSAQCRTLLYMGNGLAN